jgi:predicted ATPase
MNINDAPIIKRFEIKNLHGYKDVLIDFEKSVKIVIAENGAGKTTILSALDAFLRTDFVSLKTINFEKISCFIEGLDEPLVVEKKNINNQPVINESIVEFIRNLGVDESIFTNFILNEFKYLNEETFRGAPLITAAYHETHYGWSELWEKCIEAYNFYAESVSEDVLKVAKILREKLQGVEILYLPTYRRIEKPQYRNRSSVNRDGQGRWHKRAQKNSTINYGLGDVENRLSEITDDIQRRSNMGYRQISANIIDDLIFGSPARSDHQDLPDLETLKIFFSRVGNSNLKLEGNQKRIEQIYSSPDDSQANTLRYFLGKLASVVKQTSKLEKTIETFVEKVNDYLSLSSDSKTLIYDPVQMKVYVKNDWTEDAVGFDELSSGEKQVISLMYYLFLFDRPKIVLIDEPELSLSIEWQQKILPDIAFAPLCSQLIAITHSPFVFDNELDPYAGPLSIKKIKLGV